MKTLKIIFLVIFFFRIGTAFSQADTVYRNPKVLLSASVHMAIPTDGFADYERDYSVPSSFHITGVPENGWGGKLEGRYLFLKHVGAQLSLSSYTMKSQKIQHNLLFPPEDVPA